MKKYWKITSLTLSSLMAISGVSAVAVGTNWIDRSRTQTALNVNDQSLTENVQYVDSVDKIKMISSSGSHSLFAVVKDWIKGDHLYAWGSNFGGQLGIDSTALYVAVPTLVNFPEKAGRVNISSVTTSTGFTTVVLNKREIWSAGTNEHGQFGNGATSATAVRTFDLSYTFTKDITSISAGLGHVVAIANNKVYTWGRNNYGQLGQGDIGDATNRSAPTVLSLLNDKVLGKVKCGVYNAVVSILENNQVKELYAWGYNAGGALGVGDIENKNTPTLEVLTGIAGAVTDFYLGEETQFLVVYDAANISSPHSLYTSGTNRLGQNGMGTAKNILTPTKVDSVPSDEIVNIQSSFYATAVLTKSGYLFTTGQSNNGTSGALNTFTMLGLTNISSISLSWETSIAVSNGQMYAWGANPSGTYGNGTAGSTSASATPIRIDSFANPSVLTQSKIAVWEILDTDAANAIYANDTFQLETFEEYVNTDSFPAKTVFTMTTAPEVDGTAGTVKLTVEASESFAAPDGVISITPAEYSIILQGFKKSDNPDWALIIGLSVGIPLAVILIVGLLIWYMKRRGGGYSHSSSRGYSRRNMRRRY